MPTLMGYGGIVLIGIGLVFVNWKLALVAVGGLLYLTTLLGGGNR